MDLVQEGLGVPGSASAPVPPLDALASDEVAAQQAVTAVASDVAVLAAEGVSSSSLTSATSALSSAVTSETVATSALLTTVETT